MPSHLHPAHAQSQVVIRGPVRVAIVGAAPPPVVPEVSAPGGFYAKKREFMQNRICVVLGLPVQATRGIPRWWPERRHRGAGGQGDAWLAHQVTSLCTMRERFSPVWRTKQQQQQQEKTLANKPHNTRRKRRNTTTAARVKLVRTKFAKRIKRERNFMRDPDHQRSVGAAHADDTILPAEGVNEGATVSGGIVEICHSFVS